MCDQQHPAWWNKIGAIIATAGVHLLTGAAIGAVASDPTAAFAMGVASHVVLDILPHQDYRNRLALVADLLLAAGATAFIARHLTARERLLVIAGAAGAIMPDVEHLDTVLPQSRRLTRRFPSHSGMLKHGTGGMASTILGYTFAVAALTLVTRFRLVPRAYSASSLSAPPLP